MEYNYARTAIARKGPSRPLRAALQANAVKGRVLDYGCGRGADVAVLTALGIKAFGCDPYFQPRKPRGKFQTVLMTYVVNVLQTPQRNETLRDAWKRVKSGGRLIVTARTEKEIEDAAKRGNWRPCREVGGGWITSVYTYQRGYTVRSLAGVLGRILDGIKNMQIGPTDAGGVMIILLKE